jgi:hypothetical protein
MEEKDVFLNAGFCNECFSGRYHKDTALGLLFTWMNLEAFIVYKEPLAVVQGAL